MRVAERVTEESHADLANDAEFQETRVKCVAQVMETRAANSRPADRRLPCGLQASDGFAFERENEAFGVLVFRQQLENPGGERNFARFAFGRFGMGDVEQAAGEIDVLPSLVENLATAHAGVQRDNCDVPQMRRRSFKQEFLFGVTEDRTFLPPLAFHADACNRIRRDESFIDRPIEQMAEAFDVAVHGGFRDDFLSVAFGAVLPDDSLRDS